MITWCYDNDDDHIMISSLTPCISIVNHSRDHEPLPRAAVEHDDLPPPSILSIYQQHSSPPSITTIQHQHWPPPWCESVDSRVASKYDSWHWWEVLAGIDSKKSIWPSDTRLVYQYNHRRLCEKIIWRTLVMGVRGGWCRCMVLRES